MAFEERNHQIDNLKGMLIFLVVLGHGLELVRQDIFAAKLLYVFIYQFHMPVFVFLSGCTSKNLEKGRRNAVENFLVPFLALNIAWNVLHFAITYLYGGLDSIEKMVDHPWHSLLTPAWTLWYILALFIWKMLLPDLCRVKHVLFFSLCAGIFAGFFYEFNSFLALSRVIKLMPFFLFGYFYDTEKPRIFSWRKKLAAVAMLPITAVYTYVVIHCGVPESFFWWDRSFAASGISKPGIGVLLSIVGYLIGFGWIFAGNVMMTSKRIFLSRIGRHTLPVYYLHTYCIAVLFGVLTFIPQPALKMTAIIVFSAIITWNLSRENVSEWVRYGIRSLNTFIFRAKSE